jgi:hypothetical protein
VCGIGGLCGQAGTPGLRTEKKRIRTYEVNSPAPARVKIVAGGEPDSSVCGAHRLERHWDALAEFIVSRLSPSPPALANHVIWLCRTVC